MSEVRGAVVTALNLLKMSSKVHVGAFIVQQQKLRVNLIHGGKDLTLLWEKLWPNRFPTGKV